MILRTKSKELKLYERICKLHRWHTKFAWKPVTFDAGDGIAITVWLSKVALRHRISYSIDNNDFTFTPVYKLPNDAVLDIIDGNEEITLLQSVCPSTRSRLKDLLRKLSKQDFKNE